MQADLPGVVIRLHYIGANVDGGVSLCSKVSVAAGALGLDLGVERFLGMAGLHLNTSRVEDQRLRNSVTSLSA